MKNNQPITQKERDVSIDDNILSTTDLKGTITYINPDFIKISGFSEEELLHKNHNVVRHPDMPQAAFESLWSHVKTGQPWMGIVKNRCKDGDHYWVGAFVTPIMKDGKTIEYQSVRFKPERACVDRAETAYAKIRAGKKTGPSLGARLGLRNKLILGNLLALLPAFIITQTESLAGLTWAGFIVTTVAMGVFNAWALNPLHNLVQISKGIFDNPLMSKIHTGRDDELGYIQMALKMHRSQLNAVVGRLSDTTRIWAPVQK